MQKQQYARDEEPNHTCSRGFDVSSLVSRATLGPSADSSTNLLCPHTKVRAALLGAKAVPLTASFVRACCGGTSGPAEEQSRARNTKQTVAGVKSAIGAGFQR
jgi:hypothetical protein